MKYLIPLLVTVLLFQSCEESETNSPALQATVDSIFFRANSSSAIIDADQLSVTITGLTDFEELVLYTSGQTERTYTTGPTAVNYASYLDSDGNLYTTFTEGSSGEITIIERNDEMKYLTGSFDFKSIITDVDTIVVHQGYFYQVPFRIEDITP